MNQGVGDLSQIITGQGAIAAYHTRFFDNGPSCDCDHSFEDRSHIVYDCPQWNNIRMKYFPSNYKSVKLELLISYNKSKLGLREIINSKL
ncbi:hypothetical protein CEXT_159431 [Caerostris extrusa]|uniref:Reverse transcriptase zinc-binding domain-containing protein n=1 Tax=Caerostris extrusa TaxID=172846 RepID=A0AAV4T2S8_CAEEX|nr:hypothetical protein CEXT_159431 [Caerostris extrusa]